MSLLKSLILVLIGRNAKSYLSKAKELSDGEIADKVIKSKDSQLFGILYDRYSNKVYNKCYSFVKNSDEAKDLTQDIFLKVFLKLHLFNSSKASFSTWLYVLAYNFCTNYVNRDKKKKYMDEPMDDHEYHLSNDEVDIEKINCLDEGKLIKALDSIPPEDKSLLLLKYQDDVSIKDLQDSMGIGASAVKMRLNRAKAKVIKAYEKL
ncbi:MAG TPA: RNA polymerase subunit sigma-70 [Maribacter sp.]|uniref:RNA polymerase sigma factor n=1 Tax=unclassified Maribacter TaxID=2615042 RepID=UPI000EDC437F|nr:MULTISPECIES: RNA polymerase sigma factor [unclassified Maribacter]HAF77093.1 RNA polymerase subunit sigma-70 [Maribacter sp.]|tara:strand:+ start:7820 stop:8437 length:618 start_codon:yes stop_codon:yes gene_type:complete